MEESLVLKFTLDGADLPAPDAVAAALGKDVSVSAAGQGVYEVTFRPESEDESDAMWLMLCEIGASFPGAVLAD